MPDNVIRFPALNKTQCAIRRKNNFCEFYSDCDFKVNLDTKEKCSVNPAKPKINSVFDHLDMVEMVVDGVTKESYPSLDDFNAVKYHVCEIRRKLICAVAKIGV